MQQVEQGKWRDGCDRLDAPKLAEVPEQDGLSMRVGPDQDEIKTVPRLE